MTNTKENIYSVEVVRYISGDKLAEQTAAYLNAADPRCADFNEYGHGEQLARLLLAAYDLGVLVWEEHRGVGRNDGWIVQQTEGVSYSFAQSLVFAADDWGFVPDEVREELAGEPVDWDELSQYAIESPEWISPRFTSAWWDAQEAHDRKEN